MILGVVETEELFYTNIEIFMHNVSTDFNADCR